jgi:solute carrier family 25 carnitine/acylcarnitine transporter 20/29
MSDALKSFIAGWIGGVGNLVVGHPFDTVKTMMQNAPEGAYKSTGDCVKQIIAKEGPLALYKGVMAPMAGVGTVFALYFVSYDGCERLIRNYKKYAPKDQLTMAELMICGGSTGVVGSLVLGPAELVKVQQQTAIQNGVDGSFGATCKRLYAQGGARAFTRGLGATMARDVPGSMAWFGVYELTKRAMCEDPSKPTVFASLVAGGMGGMGMWSLALPLDVIKTRVQASSTHMSFLQGARAIAKESGMRGFFRGITPALLRAFPANAACFAARDFAQSTLDKAF